MDSYTRCLQKAESAIRISEDVLRRCTLIEYKFDQLEKTMEFFFHFPISRKRNFESILDIEDTKKLKL
jgi:hypothetical protein